MSQYNLNGLPQNKININIELKKFFRCLCNYFVQDIYWLNLISLGCQLSFIWICLYFTRFLVLFLIKIIGLTLANKGKHVSSV